MAPNSESAVAAPSPDTNPDNRPSKIVRCKHRMPTGPTGTAITAPTTMPFKKNTKSIAELPGPKPGSVSGNGRGDAMRNAAAFPRRNSRYAGRQTESLLHGGSD